jgi:hypothetical protein
MWWLFWSCEDMKRRLWQCLMNRRHLQRKFQIFHNHTLRDLKSNVQIFYSTKKTIILYQMNFRNFHFWAALRKTIDQSHSSWWSLWLIVVMKRNISFLTMRFCVVTTQHHLSKSKSCFQISTKQWDFQFKQFQIIQLMILLLRSLSATTISTSMNLNHVGWRNRYLNWCLLWPWA